MNDPYLPPSVPEVSPPPPPSLYSSEERMWAMLGHLASLSGLLFPLVGNIVGPLIVWQVKKDSMPFAASEAKEALNFNISWAIWTAVLGGATLILMFIFVGLLLIPVLAVVSVLWIVFPIIGGLRANEGKPYRYPATIRFIA
jgi:uncharacterized Tic20 family protein